MSSATSTSSAAAATQRPGWRTGTATIFSGGVRSAGGSAMRVVLSGLSVMAQRFASLISASAIPPLRPQLSRIAW